MKVVVLGAGIVGISSAWFLRQAGHEVEVIDRASGPARETSFANGGQISVSQSEPWAHPATPWQVLKWLPRGDAPLLFRPRIDLQQWRWIAGFLGECRYSRHAANLKAMVALGRYSQQTFSELRQQLAPSYAHRQQGILALLFNRQGVRHAEHACRLLAAQGIRRELISVSEAVAREPALASIAPRLLAATWCESDESGDVHRFSRQLADACVAAGVTFRYQTRINALEPAGGRITRVSITGPDGSYDNVAADAFVLALGSHSPLLLQPLGLRLPVYPLKGYSATVPVLDGSLAPQVSITDESHKLVFSRLDDMLRIAGTAELSGYSSHLNPLRCAALLRRARELFGDACDWQAARFWSGLRPATPGNVPLIGRLRFDNLWLNTGHGTLGWTEGPGSGRALAALLSGQQPALDFPFLRG
ncbi:D-amino acid dehydrogenase [Vogesella sp. LIG4]|uniref:D-amino acid dehydrogenase n=1 Tax=Vogesella sp. LIG4 TaxID=1192162 RepID=UPI00081FF54A|nr:D-amino acid dehydrogenase [Vogesella sp. LIG4]SCK07964.1 D-amino-acid dehydrogenase [Vogesella sp. LIG4]